MVKPITLTKRVEILEEAVKIGILDSYKAAVQKISKK